MTVRAGQIVTVRPTSNEPVFSGQVLTVGERYVAVLDLTSGRRVLVFPYQIVEALR